MLGQAAPSRLAAAIRRSVNRADPGGDAASDANDRAGDASALLLGEAEIAENIASGCREAERELARLLGAGP